MSKQGHVEGIHPLSPTQTGMWMQSLADVSARIFVEQGAWCLEGALDLEALRHAWQTVLDRHAALRSAIVYKGGAPLQVVVRQVPLPLRIQALDGAGEELALERLLDSEREGGFVLNRPPLIRLALLQVTPRRCWLVVTFHHLIVDGWSMTVLWAEALALYRAHVDASAPALPAAGDYRDFAAWLKTRSSQAAERYWRATLAGFGGANPVTGMAGASAPGEFERQCAAAAGQALIQVAAACRIAPALVVETLWGVLVGARSACADVVFGATVSGRPAEVPGIERMVGCFINTVPVRLRFDLDATLRACIAAHGASSAEQAEHTFCSGGQIHGWSGHRPDQPLYRSLLVYENLPGGQADEATASDLRIAGQRVHGARTALPLTLLVSPGGAALAPHLRFVFQPEAIDAAAVAVLAAELERLLTALPAWLDRPLGALWDTITPAPIPDKPGATVANAVYVAPRNQLEHALCRIWEELFQRGPIGVLDDFFSLGGHSLQALQMAARVRTELALELPLHLLIGEPTIESLALALAGETEEKASLIALASGGDGTPVYCLHPLGGHVLCYVALANLLRGAHPCWGIQAKGLQGDEAPAQSWDDLLEYHWALIAPALRAAPLVLLGYSYGGYIAMELAARAASQGLGDVTVILLDVPHLSVIASEAAAPSRAMLLHSLFGHELGMELAELEALPADALLTQVHERAMTAHVLPPGTPRSSLSRLLEVAYAHSRLRPPLRRYDFPVLLVRAGELAQRISSRDDLGWGDWVAQLKLAWSGGSHESMLEMQHAGGLLACIRADLEQVKGALSARRS